MILHFLAKASHTINLYLNCMAILCKCSTRCGQKKQPPSLSLRPEANMALRSAAGAVLLFCTGKRESQVLAVCFCLQPHLWQT